MVEGWNASTERYGLDPKIADLLRPLGNNVFYGWKNKTPLDFVGIFGGHVFDLGIARFTSARSLPDMASNRAGMRFWEDFAKNPKAFKFDICNFISKDWEEAYNP